MNSKYSLIVIVIIIIILILILLFVLFSKFKKFNLFGSENVIQGVNDEGLLIGWYYVNHLTNPEYIKFKEKYLNPNSNIINTPEKCNSSYLSYFGKWVYWKLHVPFPKNMEDCEKVIRIVNEAAGRYQFTWKFSERYNKTNFVPIQSMKQYLEILNRVKLAYNNFLIYTNYDRNRRYINNLISIISYKCGNITNYENKTYNIPLAYENIKIEDCKGYYDKYHVNFNENSQKLFNECKIKDIIERIKTKTTTDLDLIHLNLLSKGCDIVCNKNRDNFDIFVNNCEIIEASKLITIYSNYLTPCTLATVAMLLQSYFTDEQIKFNKIYSEYKMCDGAYIRLSGNINDFNDMINRYTPLIPEKTIIGYINSIKYKYKNIEDVGKYDDVVNIVKNLTVGINDEEIEKIEHPYHKLYYFDINDNEFVLPEKLTDINKCLIDEFGNKLKFDDVNYVIY
jgi:hypothetical protein